MSPPPAERMSITAPPEPLGVGAVIDGRYLLLEVIGEGAFGTVFLAEHVHIKRQVALKLLQIRHVMDETTKARFLREAQAAASIDHPSIVGVTDFGEHDGTVPYLAMEYFENDTLSEYLDAVGPIDPLTARTLLGQVAAGLAFAHEAGVIHRDLKPENLLLSPDRQAVKVTDFGLCAYGVKDKRARVTQSGQVLGTAAYIAPERLWGSEPDGRSDVYALGCILFECLSGRPVFEEDDASRAMKAHLHDAPPRLAEVCRQSVPVDLQELVHRCLAKEPEERPTMIEVIELLNPRSDTRPDDESAAGSPLVIVERWTSAGPPASSDAAKLPAGPLSTPTSQQLSVRPDVAQPESALPEAGRQMGELSVGAARVSRTAGLSAIAPRQRQTPGHSGRDGSGQFGSAGSEVRTSPLLRLPSSSQPTPGAAGRAPANADRRAGGHRRVPAMVAAAATSGILVVSFAYLLGSPTETPQPVASDPLAPPDATHAPDATDAPGAMDAPDTTDAPNDADAVVADAAGTVDGPVAPGDSDPLAAFGEAGRSDTAAQSASATVVDGAPAAPEGLEAMADPPAAAITALGRVELPRDLPPSLAIDTRGPVAKVANDGRRKVVRRLAVDRGIVDAQRSRAKDRTPTKRIKAQRTTRPALNAERPPGVKSAGGSAEAKAGALELKPF